jgi:glyoxylase-like metal-dependent hydrolase (beta-lactamase superfamily II)
MITTDLDVLRLGWPVSNVWLLPQTERGPVLIDCGFSALWPALRLGLRRHGLRPEQLGGVLLTHRHSDHAGNAIRLNQRHGVPILAHAADAAVLRRVAPRPAMQTPLNLGGGIARIENLLRPRLDAVQPFEQGDTVAGLEVIWMPGHTEGSAFLYHRPSGALFSGDTLLNAIPPSTARTGLCLPYPLYCVDHGRALRSLANFLALDLPVRTLYAGHGPPRRGPVQAPLVQLLDEAWNN